MNRHFQKRIHRAVKANDRSHLLGLIHSQKDVDDAARLVIAEAIKQRDEALAHFFLPFLTYHDELPPLTEAAQAGMTDLVEKLIEFCNATEIDALCEAASAGHVETIKILLRYADARDHESKALLAAASRGHAEVVGQLIPFSEPKARESEALVQACANGHAEVVKLLLPVSSKIQCALRGFALAAAGNHREIIDALIAAGLPDPEDTYCLGLDEAASKGYEELTQTLLRAVISTEQTPMRFGYDALVDASAKGHTAIVKAIIELANPMEEFEQALCLALSQGHDEVVDLLVSRADLDFARELALGRGLVEKLDEAVARGKSAKQYRELQANERARTREGLFGEAADACQANTMRTTRL
jgi:ankyrin repeat protein